MRTSLLSRQQLDRIAEYLPSWLVDKVPRDHRESDAAFHRRRRVVTAVSVVGAGLLGVGLSTRPGSKAFYVSTFGVAATWVVGGFASGPLHLGWMEGRDESLKRPVITPMLTGAGAFGVFYGAALVCKRVPVLADAIASILKYADQGSTSLVTLTTLLNGAAEEIFFRGALYAAVGVVQPVAWSTAVYAVATIPTRNPSLVLAATVMGALFAAQRRSSGGIQAPVLTHLTWSVLMLRFLPPLYSDHLARDRMVHALS